MIVVPPRSTLFPYTTLFRSHPELAGRLLETVQRGLVTVVSDPQLGLHEDLRPLQAGLPDALADLTLVAIGGGSVDQPVTDPQGFADRRSGLLGWGLEDAEAQCRHRHAVVQCDVCTHTSNARFAAPTEEGTVSTPFAAPEPLGRSGGPSQHWLSRGAPAAPL